MSLFIVFLIVFVYTWNLVFFICCCVFHLSNLKPKRPHTTQSRTATPCLCIDLLHPQHFGSQWLVPPTSCIWRGRPTLTPRCRRLSWNDSKVGNAAPCLQHCELTAVPAALAVGNLLVRFGSMFICIVSAWSREKLGREATKGTQLEWLRWFWPRQEL